MSIFVLFMRIVQTVAIKAAAYITPDRQHANANFSVDIIINYARYNWMQMFLPNIVAATWPEPRNTK